MQRPFALIVEDDRDIAALFRHVLDMAGYKTEMAMDGREAVERLKTIEPDIVLLDLTVPVIPGPKILEWMRAESRLRDVPVVVVTAHSQLAENLTVEPDLILLKPVNLGQLSGLVQRLHNMPHSLVQPPWDPVTHLYNKEFFKVRLGYSLERARQIGLTRFGILFAEVRPFADLRRCLDCDGVDMFLREVSGHLKTRVRPTDTVSHFGDGRFLILIEEMPEYSTPSSIVRRVEGELADFIGQKNLMEGLHANVGLLICHAHYGSVDEILGDVEIACRLSVTGQARVEFERDTLRKLRAG